MNSDLDRLLELARKAKAAWVGTGPNALRDTRTGADLAEACDPDTIIALIERVKEAEGRSVSKQTLDVSEWIRNLEARLRAAEEVVEAFREAETIKMPPDGQMLEARLSEHRRLTLEARKRAYNALRRYDEAVARVKEE